MNPLDEENQREWRLRRAEAKARGEQWPPRGDDSFDWFRWVVYGFWLIPAASLIYEAVARALPAVRVLVATRLGAYLIGGAVTLGLAAMLVFAKSSSPRIYALMTLIAAFVLGGDAFYKFTSSTNASISDLVAIGGAIYFAREAIEEWKRLQSAA